MQSDMQIGLNILALLLGWFISLILQYAINYYNSFLIHTLEFVSIIMLIIFYWKDENKFFNIMIISILLCRAFYRIIIDNKNHKIELTEKDKKGEW